MGTREDLRARVEDIRRDVQLLDPNLKPDSDGGRCAVFLLLAADQGCFDEGFLAEAVGVPESQAKEWADNLRKNGVWAGGKIVADWLNEERGMFALWCDVLVAQGLARRA